MANFAVRSSHLNTHSRVECVNQISIYSALLRVYVCRLEVGTVGKKKPHGLIACNFRCARASQWQEVPHDGRDEPSIRGRPMRFEGTLLYEEYHARDVMNGGVNPCRNGS